VSLSFQSLIVLLPTLGIKSDIDKVFQRLTNTAQSWCNSSQSPSPHLCRLLTSKYTMRITLGQEN